MTREPAPSSGRRAALLVIVMLVVAALYLARDLFLPLALAALFTFLLAPVVGGLQRLHLPRMVAVIITMTAAVGAVVALGVTVVGQFESLGRSLPEYRDTIRKKLLALDIVFADIEHGLSGATPTAADGAPSEPSSLGAPATDLAAERLQRGPQTGSPASDRSAPWLLPWLSPEETATAPVRVTVVPGRPSTFDRVTDLAGPLLGPLGTMALVFVLILFLLIYLDDLRDRIVAILSVRDVTMSIQAVTEVSQRISRYLVMNLIVNATYGIPVGVGLYLLGIPNAFLWGLLATLLRFIPYLGPWLAASMPIALSFAIAPGWGLTIAVLGLFLVLELVSNNVVEPWLYGSRTGLSPLAIILAAVFWTWLWGAVGLLLSVPLTLILVVSGRYIPQLRFLYTLFGDGPGLGPEARFYQRLVAKDPDAAARVAEDYLDRRPLPDLYDAVFIPALRSLKRDETEGRLTSERADAILKSLVELAVVLPALSEKREKRRLKLAQAERTEAAKATGLERVEAAATEHAVTAAGEQAAGEAEAAGGAPLPTQAPRVVFIPAGDETDAVVGPLLADLLRADGIAVETLPPTTLLSDLAQSGVSALPDVLVVGGFLPGSLVRLRNLVARAAEHAGERARIVAGLWDAPVDEPPPDSAPAPRRLIRFGRRPAKPTLLSQLRERPAVDARAAASLAEVGAHEVVHRLSEAADAVRRALRHRAMGIAA